MPNKLTVSTDNLHDAARNFYEAEADLQNAIQSLESAINRLRESDWKSNASSVYFRNYENKWKKNLSNCLEMMRFMREALESSARDYEQLSNDSKDYMLNKVQ